MLRRRRRHYQLVCAARRCLNAILKVARSTQTCDGATLYITLSPCKECSKLIHQSGIKRVVYQLGYRDTTGVDFLTRAGVIVEQIEDLDR